MAQEFERPRITEIQVRMDCNGCVQKLKKALHGIKGIYDLYIDFPQQKLTVVGWADPEKIVKAIRKTRKIATICSHIEQPEPSSNQPTEQTPEGDAAPPPADGENPPPPEGPPAEEPQQGEPPEDQPPPENPVPPENPPPPPENPLPPPPEVKPTPIAADTNANQQAGPSGSKDKGEVHVIHHHPPDYGYRYGYPQSYPGHWNRYPSGQVIQQEAPQGLQGPQPIYVTHSYNTYKPSPYVTEYEYVRSPPRYTHYSRMDHYSEDYHNSNNVYYSNSYGNGNISSMFSDENPNACRIM